MKKNTLDTTREQINKKKRIQDEISAIQSKLSSSRILGLIALQISRNTASNKFRNFVEYHGKGSEEKVPLTNQPEMNRLKTEAMDLQKQVDPINKEKEHLTTTLKDLEEQLATISIPLDLATIHQQQEEIDQEKETISALEKVTIEQQKRLDLVTATNPDDLNIVRKDLLAEKAMGKDVSEDLASIEKDIADQETRMKATKNEATEIRMTIDGLNKKIEGARRHVRYLEGDKKQMVLQFLKNESVKTEKEYLTMSNSLIDNYCRLRSLYSLIGQVSENIGDPVSTPNAYQFKIPTIGQNVTPGEYLFNAVNFEQFGACLEQEKERLLALGVQC